MKQTPTDSTLEKNATFLTVKIHLNMQTAT